MPQGRQVELPFLSKAPFANYDLVVYLGGGLFAVLIFWRYIVHPFNIFDFSDLVTVGSQSWVADVIYLLLLGVCSYVIGHMISYQSSYFIEGFVEKTLGKFSKIIEVTTVERNRRAAVLKGEIRKNTCRNLLCFSKVPWVGCGFRRPKLLPTLFHLPVIPWYVAVWMGGLFDFADTRVPSRMLCNLKREMKVRFKQLDFENNRQWFRWVEYYTAYNRPVAAASMYNYLVISGLMRSLAYLFLIAIWLELAHLGWTLRFGEPLISHGQGGAAGWLLYFLMLYVAYITTVTSYCKFFRRYVEEAILGFLLEGSPRISAAGAADSRAPFDSDDAAKDR